MFWVIHKPHQAWLGQALVSKQKRPGRNHPLKKKGPVFEKGMMGVSHQVSGKPDKRTQRFLLTHSLTVGIGIKSKHTFKKGYSRVPG